MHDYNILLHTSYKILLSIYIMQHQQPDTELRHHEDGALSGGEEDRMQDVHEQWLDIAEDFLEDSKILASCIEERDTWCLEQEDGQETDYTRILFQLVREIFFHRLRPAYVCLDFLDALDERVMDNPLSKKSSSDRFLVSMVLSIRANKG